LAANLKYDFDGGDLDVFGNLAVVPLEYTSDNAPNRNQVKTPNENKWLSGAQVGVTWRFNEDNALRAAVGYYDFKNISGRLSSPVLLYAGADGCDTDWSRPAFMQKGNTLMLIRDIARNPLVPANTPTPQ
ncbi:putative porin, partial [Stutzerimonas stutzeri]|uniref:putative porin n=1 Tax=Stutzerimonas stutzeri TaxID=316 RepID=UPI001BD66390